MKACFRMIPTVLVVGTVMTVPAFAADKGSITTDINALLSSKVNAELQQSKGKGLTSYISGALIDSPTVDATDLEVKLGFGVNRFFTVKSLSGPYVGGGVTLAAKGISSYSVENSMYFGLKGNAGYKWVLGGGFTMDARGEAYLDVMSLTSNQSGTSIGTGSLTPTPKLALYLGYSW